MKTFGEVSADKLRGGFYTPPALVRRCLDRVAELVGDRQSLAVLEPSAGDGAFIRGLREHPLARRVDRLTAIELVPEEAARCRAEAAAARFASEVIAGSVLARGASGLARGASGLAHGGTALAHGGPAPAHGDRAGARFDIATGNPPFVRFQFVGDGDRRAAAALADDLGVSFAGVSNLWIPVLLAALGALRDGGAFAFIVPAEILTGISADVARRWLAGRASPLQLDLFPVGSYPGVLQEVVIVSGLVASPASPGPPASPPRLLLAEHGPAGQARRWQHVIAAGSRTWTGYLLEPAHLGALEEARSLKSVRTVGDLARFEVATVTGANGFFTVAEETLGAYQLSQWALPLLPRTRHATGLEFTEDDYALLRESGRRAHLLSFSADRPAPAGALARAYLRHGEQAALPDRYKCRIRAPWYRVPVAAPGQIMMSKRAHRYPRLILNRAGVHTTDTIYRGRMLPGADRTAADLVAAFHSSLTLLTAEIEGRSFGGGVLELVPTEAGRLLAVVPERFGDEVERLDLLARAGSGADGEALIEETGRLLAKSTAGLTASLLDTLRDARLLLLARRMARNAPAR